MVLEGFHVRSRSVLRGSTRLQSDPGVIQGSFRVLGTFQKFSRDFRGVLGVFQRLGFHGALDAFQGYSRGFQGSSRGFLGFWGVRQGFK